MLVDRLKTYGWTAVAIAATTLLAAQTWRLHSAQLDAATTRTAHADTLRTIAVLSAKALSAVRARETQWAQAQEKNAYETGVQLSAARADADIARRAGERMQQRVAALVAAARAAPTHPVAEPTVAPAGATIDLLAHVQHRLDRAAGELAEYADAARIAGASCERDYGALSQ